MDDDRVIQAAARVLAKSALMAYQADPHQWSERPCQTCRVVSAVIGEPWGCYRYALDRQKSRSQTGDKHEGV